LACLATGSKYLLWGYIPYYRRVLELLGEMVYPVEGNARTALQRVGQWQYVFLPADLVGSIFGNFIKLKKSRVNLLTRRLCLVNYPALTRLGAISERSWRS